MGEDREKNSYVYEFDELNRMEKIYRGDGKWAEYSYDGTSARVGKTVGTAASTETETTKYYNLGATVLNEVSSEEGNTTNLIGAGIEARLNVSGGYFLQKNAHGDVTAAISGTERAATYDYDAFGNTLVEEGEINNPIRYSGEYLDEETGLIYLRARYYDSSVGRFISEDPIRDGMNWYAYCGNSPVMMVDPWGLYTDYAFYGDEHQMKAAELYKKEVEANDSSREVKLVEVKNAQQFNKGWNAMDNDGKPIETVAIFLHGLKPWLLGANNGEEINISSLKNKTIKTLLITACNSGNIDYRDNIASQFLRVANIKNVIAPDGYVRLSVKHGDKDKLEARVSFWSESGTTPSARRADAGEANKGFCLYQKKNGIVVRTVDNIIEYVDRGKEWSTVAYLLQQVVNINFLIDNGVKQEVVQFVYDSKRKAAHEFYEEGMK